MCGCCNLQYHCSLRLLLYYASQKYLRRAKNPVIYAAVPIRWLFYPVTYPAGLHTQRKMYLKVAQIFHLNDVSGFTNTPNQHDIQYEFKTVRSDTVNLQWLLKQICTAQLLLDFKVRSTNISVLSA